jgi:thioredoxin reductase
VYGSSEGLDVLVLETSSPGGQAGSSSRIENYLGFPIGISGQELAGRAHVQAQKFGTDILIANATRLVCDSKPYIVELESGARILTRTIVIATGAEYRRPGGRSKALLGTHDQYAQSPPTSSDSISATEKPFFVECSENGPEPITTIS